MAVLADASAESLNPFITGAVEPGSTVITDAWQGYSGLRSLGYTRERRSQRAARARGEDPGELLLNVHRVAALAKRWLLGTHQGSVDEAHLPAYLDEFVFRFNRRSSRSRGLVFYRVLELAAGHDPVRFRDLLAGKKPRPAPATWGLGHPPTLERPAANRPWRTGDLQLQLPIQLRLSKYPSIVLMALKGRRSAPEERLQAVQLLKEGNEAAVVARMFSVSRAMLFRWQQKYDQGGPVALETKKTPGPASRLSPTQLSKLYAIITGSDPRQLEFDFGLWTRKIIRELIRREFGVKLSEVQVGRLLNKMGLSPQRPLYRAYQQDPERVEEWKKSAYPKIRKLAAEEGASIFFADEASIRTDHHAGTTWAPVGQTPVVITTGERKSVNMVSAISPRGELRFRVQEGTMNAGKFIDFLKALLDSVPGKIFLIVDGHPVHKAKKVSEFVKEKADGRLSIFFLPPYSPDLNPDEWVWNNVKNDRIGRSVIMSADDLKAKAIGALRRLQKLPGIVRGFLRDPKLAYILELHLGTARGVYKGISSLVRYRRLFAWAPEDSGCSP